MKSLILLIISCVFSISIGQEEITIPIYNPNELIEKFANYGKSWMYFPDDRGNPQIIPLTFTDVIPEIYSPTKNFIKYYLYTRHNKHRGQVLKLNDIASLNHSHFDPKKPTKIFIHGWTSSYKSDTSQTIKNNFLKTHDYNVILIDWSKIASNLMYPVPVLETRNIGDTIGHMIDFLHQNGLKLEDLHIIGHSLGAHIAGRAGHAVKSGKVERITGLDPALPGFEGVSTLKNRLDKTDGKFVDIIHTCGGVLGYYSKLGHADFYPNGGIPSQPGCFGLPQIIEGCSHGKAWKYFAHSILKQDDYIGTFCDTWENYKRGKCDNNNQVPMGDATPHSINGTYYLKTGSNFPFDVPIFGDTVQETTGRLATLSTIFG